MRHAGRVELTRPVHVVHELPVAVTVEVAVLIGRHHRPAEQHVVVDGGSGRKVLLLQGDRIEDRQPRPNGQGMCAGAAAGVAGHLGHEDPQLAVESDLAIERPEPARPIDRLTVTDEVAPLAAEHRETVALLQHPGVVGGIVGRLAEVVVVAEEHVLEQPEHPPVGQRICVLIVAPAEAFDRGRRAEAGRREKRVQLRRGQPRAGLTGRHRNPHGSSGYHDHCRRHEHEKEPTPTTHSGVNTTRPGVVTTGHPHRERGVRCRDTRRARR